MLNWEEYCKLKGAKTLEEQKSLMLASVEKYNAVGEELMEFLSSEAAVSTIFDLTTAKFEVQGNNNGRIFKLTLLCNGAVIWTDIFALPCGHELAAEMILNEGKRVKYIGIAVHTRDLDPDDSDWREKAIYVSVDSNRQCSVFSKDPYLCTAGGSRKLSYSSVRDILE